MSDTGSSIPPSEPPATPPPSPPPPPVAPTPGGIGKTRGIGVSILLAIVTLGIYTIFWVYYQQEEMKRYSGNGLGGVLGVVIYILIGPVTWFVIPNEVKNLYEADGRESPVSAIWGLWILLPIIGNFVWFIKVQGAINDFWVSKGAAPPA